MERERKFRAWTGEKMEYDFLLWSNSNEVYLPDENEQLVQFDWIVMQYTGLKDKNDVQIYVGDVVHYDGYRDQFKGVVECGEFDAYWPTGAHESAMAVGYYVMMKGETYSLKQMTSFKHDNTPFETIEVIGNIYSNPELCMYSSQGVIVDHPEGRTHYPPTPVQ